MRTQNTEQRLTDREKAEIFFSLFRPNQRITTVMFFNDEGRKVPYQVHGLKADVDLLERVHFGGYPTGSHNRREYLGIVASDNGLIKFINCDYDAHTEGQDPNHHINRDLAMLSDLGIQPMISRSSGGGGYHLNIFADRPYPAKEVYPFVAALHAWRKSQGEEEPEVKPQNYGNEKGAGVILLPRSGWQPFLNSKLEPISDEEALLNVQTYTSDQLIEASKTIARAIGVDWAVFRDCQSVAKVKPKEVRPKARVEPKSYLYGDTPFDSLKKVFPNVGSYLAYKGYHIPEDTNVDCPFHSPINTPNTFGWTGHGCKCFSTRCDLHGGMSLIDLIKYVEGVDNVFKWAASKGLITLYKYNSGWELANKLKDIESYEYGVELWKKNKPR